MPESAASCFCDTLISGVNSLEKSNTELFVSHLLHLFVLVFVFALKTIAREVGDTKDC